MTPDRVTGSEHPDRSGADLTAIFREQWGQVLATLIAGTGDWDLAEECVQDAFALALAHWPHDGVPDRPGAWLTTTARRRAHDRRRRTQNEARKLEELAMGGPPPTEPEPGPIPDDQLSLIFTCAHPALPLESRVALTVRSLTGLRTAEIARAFLVPEATMAQRISRAKRKIKNAGIPFRVPPPEMLAERTGGVLAVLYLLFNEGYSASLGPDMVRPDLSGEAIRLGRVLHRLLPADAEVGGLLALMLLQDSRRNARLRDGRLVPLEEQDRSAWDRASIDEGLAVLERHPLDPAGSYRLQARIAAVHAVAGRAEDTDWPLIASLYGDLAARTGSPFVELGRAVAVAMADGPLAGLQLVRALEESGRLDGYHLLPATAADLWRRLGSTDEAATAYRAAVALAPTEPERRYLARRLAEVSPGG